MKLKKHNRYPYSPINERPNFSWPDGKRLAFYIALNVEDFTFGTKNWGTRRPIPARRLIRATMPGGIMDCGSSMWLNLRISLDELKLPMCHLINSLGRRRVIRKSSPASTRAATRMVGHGRTNSERQADYPEEERTPVLIRGGDPAALTKAQGRAPGGSMGPWISEKPRYAQISSRRKGYQYILGLAAG